MYDYIFNSLFSDGLVKVYNRSNDYHIGDYWGGILLLKFILDKSSLQTHATVMIEKAILANLYELIARLIHNLSKFNSVVISTINNLKRNRSSVPNLLHQLLPTYLLWLYNKFHDYITLK